MLSVAGARSLATWALSSAHSSLSSRIRKSTLKHITMTLQVELPYAWLLGSAAFPNSSPDLPTPVPWFSPVFASELPRPGT